MLKRQVIYAALTGAASLAFSLTPVMAATTSNDTTGAESDNNATVSVNNDASILQQNTLTVKNNISVSSNTGGNTASKNTGDGTVSSGDASAGASVSNVGNTNALSVSGGMGGDPTSASNSTTGAESHNDAKVDVNNNIDLTQKNDANVNNNVDIKAETGNNSADKNTGDGSVTSGDADVDVMVKNDLNKNTLDITGMGDSDISVSNDHTGYKSDNDATVDINNDADLLQNNELRVNNDLDIKANTGDNSADKNTGDGSVTSGDADVDVVISTTGNTNDLSMSGMGGSSDFDISNDTTGAKSDNDAKVDVDNDLDLTQKNDSCLTTDGDIKAESGENTADKNTGDGSVMGGDTEVDVQVSADVNVNTL
jgi:hypothetical protein